MPRKPSTSSPRRRSPTRRTRSPRYSPTRRSPTRRTRSPRSSPKRTSSPKDTLGEMGETFAAVITDGQNDELIKKQQIEELNKLAPGETNWFSILTSMSFIIRLFIVVAVMVVCALAILKVTLDPNSKSWFNQLYKPDWMPDGITITVIFAFLSFLLAWCWYRFAQVSRYSMLINLLFLVVLGLQLAWALNLYTYRRLVVARYLVSFFLGFVALLFILSLFTFGFSDVSLYTFLYTGWLVLVLLFTFNMHELDKEYKMLGIVKDKNSSLYKRKMKMEAVQGIKVDENGVKTVFNPDEQE